MFSAVDEIPLPEPALLQRYTSQGHYTDCFATTVTSRTSVSDYVEAFYTTALFRSERFILARFASLPSTNEEARAVARGERNSFAAWSVEERTEDQLLLVDVRQRTGSWFMTAPDCAGSRLYFGSVVFRDEAESAGRRMPSTYESLLGFHRLYSRALLSAARSRLLRQHRSRRTS